MLYDLFRKTVKAISGKNTGITRIPFVPGAYDFIVKRFHPAQISVDGMKIYLDKDDSMRLSVFDSPYEKEYALYHRVVKGGWNVIDVGANIGYFTHVFSRLVGEKGRVVAFEPFPEAFALLKKSAEANGLKNVSLEPLALSDTIGKSTLYLSDKNFGDNSLVERKGENGVLIRTTTLDAYAKEKGITRIDMVKIDTQGAEYEVLKGMAAVIRNFHPAILCEIWPPMSGKEKSLELLSLLSSEGYTFETEDGAKIEDFKKFVDDLCTSKLGFSNVFCTYKAKV